MAGIYLKPIERDKACNYCLMSEYRDEYDNRIFYRLGSEDRMSSTTICEICARRLFLLLANTLYAQDIDEEASVS